MKTSRAGAGEIEATTVVMRVKEDRAEEKRILVVRFGNFS